MIESPRMSSSPANTFAIAVAALLLCAFSVPGIQTGSNVLPAYELHERYFQLEEAVENPYDSNSAVLDAEIRTPDNQTLHLPLFYDGEKGWGIRYTPSIPGRHHIQVLFRQNKSQAKKLAEYDIEVSANSGNSGFIRVSKKNPRYFAFDNGAAYFPLGQNMGWILPLEKWPHYLQRTGDTGANWIRVWMCSWGRMALEWTKKTDPNVYHDLDAYSLANARRVDDLLKGAQEHGLYVQLVFNNHGQFSSKTNPEWDSNPYNTANGGFLKSPEEFFTHPESLRRYKDRLRYLVGRYGWSTHIFAWELWNEVNLTSNYDYQTVADWHKQMSAVLKELDSYDHPVTTSGAGGHLQHQQFEGMDFLQTHAYIRDVVGANLVGGQYALEHNPDRPHFFGEMGTDASGPQREDAEGVSLHDMLWASIHSGASGTAMTWWWDNWVEPLNLYHHFSDAHAYVRDIDWIEEDFHPIRAEVLPQAENQGPLVFAGLAGWRRSETDRFEISADGTISNSKELPTFIYAPEKADLRIEPAFAFESESGGVFALTIAKVAKAGAEMTISLNGDEVIQRNFPAGNEDYVPEDGTLKVVFPPGKHEIRLSNGGVDWLIAGQYCLDGVTQRLQTAALGGNRRALIWIRDRSYDWRDRVASENLPDIKPTDVYLHGLPDGEYTCEMWDTWTGEVQKDERVYVREALATLHIPTFRRDMAFRLMR